MSASRVPFSLVVITKNAASQLAACLESVPFADEKLVVDSGSTDGTVALAERLGARVIHQDWLGFGPQKQFAVEQAAHDWVLCLDADERLTPELAASIRGALEGPVVAGYYFARCNRFLGRYLRHGEGYPDLSLRLFDRRLGAWSDCAVHEKVVVRGATVRLPGDLQHDSAETLERYLDKQNRYTSLAARGCGPVSAVRMVASPLVRFVKFYLFRRGFMDGVPGLVHVCIGCFNSFMKYAKARECAGAPQRDV